LAEIRFYHLTRQSADQAIPQILGKVLSSARRAVVRLADEKAVEAMNEHLWIFRADSFLPHGSVKDGFAEYQPVWLTAADENPNGADVLIRSGISEIAALEGFSLCCDMLDGTDDSAVQAARTRWTAYKTAGHDVTYWQQGESGGWEKKA